MSHRRAVARESISDDPYYDFLEAARRLKSQADTLYSIDSREQFDTLHALIVRRIEDARDALQVIACSVEEP